MTNELRSLIGRGISFPIDCTQHTLNQSEDIRKINQSLLMLFETPKGQRLFLPDYGTNLRLYRFEPNDEILVLQLRSVLTEDVIKWEPRISVTNIEFFREPNMIDNNVLYIGVSYTVKNTSESGSFVYPYQREPYDSVDSDIID